MNKTRYNIFKNCKDSKEIIELLNQKFEENDFELTKNYIFDNIQFLFYEDPVKISLIFLISCIQTNDDILAYKYISLVQEMSYINQETEEFIKSMSKIYSEAKEALLKEKNKENTVDIEQIKKNLYYGDEIKVGEALYEVYSLSQKDIDVTKSLIAALKIRKFYDKAYFLIFVQSSLLNFKDTITFEKNFVQYTLNLGDYFDIFKTVLTSRNDFVEYLQKNSKNPSTINGIVATFLNNLSYLFPEYMDDFNYRAFYKSCMYIAYTYYFKDDPELEPAYSNYLVNEEKFEQYCSIISMNLNDQKTIETA